MKYPDLPAAKYPPIGSVTPPLFRREAGNLLSLVKDTTLSQVVAFPILQNSLSFYVQVRRCCCINCSLCVGLIWAGLVAVGS
ncbi:hypothetical protein SERLA73DRAFT_180405 [Serpula lacrymans var. lacrymans S7.3]|uniref:Uncharacterized protein n=2 Tax=Serpula lacrymans var. lacrymans TaxID=341189 RepID=F8PUJ5_SERL3|nr:uncharacterized protein SERLADRAFT_465998 [Serpula lacrymans var. lacrymans S7.9]EGO00030.1 hypothetical protein SERLA73DRAFT_180405 [Serpula lacrymans var. lacrymans S7.3]EGO25602.1 hypothetical protein SERLADRAFT_465998 [Serpula lacrymans var. lacrymans S7.9]